MLWKPQGPRQWVNNLRLNSWNQTHLKDVRYQRLGQLTELSSPNRLPKPSFQRCSRWGNRLHHCREKGLIRVLIPRDRAVCDQAIEEPGTRRGLMTG